MLLNEYAAVKTVHPNYLVGGVYPNHFNYFQSWSYLEKQTKQLLKQCFSIALTKKRENPKKCILLLS